MYNEPNELKDICYDKDFLKDVIIRVDLISPMELLNKQIPKELSKQALKYFPISEPRKTIAKGFELSPHGVKNLENVESMEWHFFGKDREKTLTITPNSIIINHKKYKEFQYMRDEFFAITKKFFEVFPEAQGSRLGLRYINEIKFESKDVFSWDNYINNNLLGVFNFHENRSEYARLFHNIEFNFDTFNLKFQFGMHNPDYPSKIVQKIFILDYDAYHQGLMEQNEILDCVDKFHLKIQTLFEKSIKEELRKILNG